MCKQLVILIAIMSLMMVEEVRGDEEIATLGQNEPTQFQPRLIDILRAQGYRPQWRARREYSTALRRPEYMDDFDAAEMDAMK